MIAKNSEILPSKSIIEEQNSINFSQNKSQIGSSKNIIPLHTQNDISRRESLNHIEQILNATRKITSKNSLSFASSIARISGKNINNSRFDNDGNYGESATLNNVLENINKIDMKKKKKRRKRNMSSSDEEEYERKKPKLQMIEVDPLLVSLSRQVRSKKEISKEVDEFLKSQKSFGRLNRSNLNHGKSKNGDLSLLMNEEDSNGDGDSHGKRTKQNRKNYSDLRGTGSFQDILDKNNRSQTDLFGEEKHASRTNITLDNNGQGSRKSIASGLGNSKLSKDLTWNNFTENDPHEADLMHNKENIYSFRGKKRKNSQGSDFSDELNHKKSSLNSSHLADIDLMRESDFGSNNQFGKLSTKSPNKFHEFQLLAQSHPSYNIDISNKKKAEMLYRIRNRIMVSMISIHHMKKQHPTTNQQQINARVLKQTKDIQQISKLVASRPRWNSPQGYRTRSPTAAIAKSKQKHFN